MISSMTLKERLRELIEAAGLNHGELAQLLGPTKSKPHPDRVVVTKWLNDEAPIPAVRLREIMDRLGERGVTDTLGDLVSLASDEEIATYAALLPAGRLRRLIVSELAGRGGRG